MSVQAQDLAEKPATAEILLQINNVEVIYDHVILVLKGVSLSVPKGGIVALLGATDALIGRSHECDFPTEIKSVPALTAQNTHYDPESGIDAKAIDTQVASATQSGCSSGRR